MNNNLKAPTGLPSWFRATCHEASRGGSTGYGYAGRQLGRHTPHEIPYSLEDNEWDAEVDALLRGHCANRDLNVVAADIGRVSPPADITRHALAASSPSEGWS